MLDSSIESFGNPSISDDRATEITRQPRYVARASTYQQDHFEKEAAALRNIQEDKSAMKKELYSRMNKAADITIQISNVNHELKATSFSTSDFSPTDCYAVRKRDGLLIVGPLGKKQVPLLEWFPKGSLARKVLREIELTSTLEGSYAEKQGVLLKLSKELGYFGITSLGERFQERLLSLRAGSLSYKVPGSSSVIYSIPLKGCYVEICPKGDPRRKDAFDRSCQGASGHFVDNGKEFNGWLSRRCISVHKPLNMSIAHVYDPSLHERPSLTNYFYRYMTGSNKGPGKLAYQARTFYFSLDDSSLMDEWFEAIKKNIQITDLDEHPMRAMRRLISEVGGDISTWDMEDLLDQLYGYDT